MWPMGLLSYKTFLWFARDEQYNSICGKSSFSKPQHLYVALTTQPLNVHFFDCNKYVPGSNLHLTIPFLMSDTVDSKDHQTGCTLPMHKKFAFKYFNDDFCLASFCNISVQYLLTAVFVLIFHWSFDESSFPRDLSTGKSYNFKIS